MRLLADTSFDDAEESLRRFLRDNECGDDIQWVFFEDLICPRMEILIRTPLPPDNRERARLCFELGKDRNFGISLHALCSVGDDTFCYIVLPRDDMDAQYRMMGNHSLKLQIRRQVATARRVSGFLWPVRRSLTKSWNAAAWESEMPSRVTLLPKFR